VVFFWENFFKMSREATFAVLLSLDAEWQDSTVHSLPHPEVFFIPTFNAQGTRNHLITSTPTGNQDARSGGSFSRNVPKQAHCGQMFSYSSLAQLVECDFTKDFNYFKGSYMYYLYQKKIVLRLNQLLSILFLRAVLQKDDPSSAIEIRTGSMISQAETAGTEHWFRKYILIIMIVGLAFNLD
jgi:hypothetical protein